jgi:hypothetical protein
MDEKTLGLNNGEERTPSGGGQPHNNASDSELNPEEIESEIDKTLSNHGDDDEIDLDGDGEETVVLPKKQVKQLLRDKKNYREGLLSVKDKLKHGFKKPVQKTEEKPQPKAGDDVPVTHADLNKINEKKAIVEACKDEEVDKNWAEIVKFYTPRRGKDSPEAIVADIQDAKTLWEKNAKPKDGEKAGEDKKSTADLAADKGKPSSQSGEGKPTERKSILTKKVPVKEWY